MLQFGLLIPMYSVISQGLTNYDPSAMWHMFGINLFPGIVCPTAPDVRRRGPRHQRLPQPGRVRASSRGACPSRRRPAWYIAGFGISVLAIVSSLVQLVASRMTLPVADPKNDDPNMKVQRQMAYFLPLISILYGGALPAGLFIYWITATLIQIVQQYLILGWGSMFPLFGWYPEFARNHKPRFPVKMPEPSPPDPANPSARTARRPWTGTSPPNRPSGPTASGAADEGDDADMSEYQEFTGKSVEEAIKAACDQFRVGLGDLDFEILTPGRRGVLGMGAEPARIVAAPRSALGGAAPKRQAAESQPLPPAAAPRGPRPRSTAIATAAPRRPAPADRDSWRPAPGATTAPAPAPRATAAQGDARGRPPPAPRRPAPAPRRPRRPGATIAPRAATSDRAPAARTARSCRRPRSRR